LDVGEGAQVVEIGCGPQGCLELLARRVGPTGRVVGVERSEDAVVLAKAHIAENKLDTVEVINGDARATGLPHNTFDLVTARLVLVNVPDPQEIVNEAVALAHSGGQVAFHEADYIAHICDPPLKEWTRAVDLLEAYSAANGIDLFIGRKTPGLLRSAGLVDVEATALVHVYPPGHARRPILVDFLENLSDRLIDGGFTTHDELRAMIQQISTHIADPNTTVLSHLFIQAWGRKA
ncbi:MAG: hypothetical protein QOD39_4247, partial [Mycobacterium sp.]|nr:hypothetical protein [Mycobacterium sp.]